MKRTLFVVALVSAALTACGGGDDDEAGGAGPSAATAGSTSKETIVPETAVVRTELTVERAAESSTTEAVPTTTVAETTPPAPDQGTRDNPVPLGQAAEVGGGWTAVVNSVNLNANEQVASANQFNEPPADGNVFILANVTVTYNGTEPSDTGGVNFEALGAATNTAIGVGSGSSAVAPEPLESFTEVFQGGSLTGNVLLEVPVADIDTLVLIGHAFLSFDDDERSFFATTGTPVTPAPVAPATPVPPAAAGGALGSRGNPVPLGQAAEVGGGWTAVVNSVNLNANEQVASANQFNEPPADGNVFILANVTVTYNGTEPSDTGGVNFEALGAATNTAIGVGSGSSAVAPEPLESFTEVFQGGSLTGNVLLEVPVADIDTLVLIGHAFLSFDDDERSFFATR